MDKATANEAFVREFQARTGLKVDGWAGKATLGALDALKAPVPIVGTKTTSERGKAAIKSHEGLRLIAYPDPATGDEPWTIGYGHTGGVKRGQTITPIEADRFLASDLLRFERAVSQLCPITTQGQFDALVSFAFNLGEGSLKESTLRRKHNDGDYIGAAMEFRRWNKANGKVMAGLSRRREEEAEMYRS